MGLLSVAKFSKLAVSSSTSESGPASNVSVGISKMAAVANPVLAHRVCSVMPRPAALGPSGSLRLTALAFDRSIIIESLMAKVLRTFGSEIPVSLATARCIVSPIF